MRARRLPGRPRIVVPAALFVRYLLVGVVVLIIGSFCSGALVYLFDAAVAVWALVGLGWLWQSARRGPGAG
jgi:hypothetical protein